MDTSMRMLNLLALVICLYIGASSSMDVVGYCGGSVSIKCEYESRHGSRPKYFCLGEQGNCKEVIRTNMKNKWFTKDRYSLLDNGTHYFVVAISGLQVSDAGKYQCGVSVRGQESLVQTEVNLDIKNDLFTCGLTLVKTAYTNEAMNVTCPYLDAHVHAAKYLCKSFRSQGCDSRLSVREDRTWVHSERISLYDDRQVRAFIAVLGALGKLDRGNYWCGVETGWEHGGEDGYKALIQKVQLTVSGAPMMTTPPQPLQVTTGPSTIVQNLSTDPATSRPNGLTTIPVKLLTTSTNPSTIEAEGRSSPPPHQWRTERHDRGQSSLMPEQVFFSTPVPIIESSSGLWRIIIYGIVALFFLVILSSLLLLVITRSKKAKATDAPAYLVSLEPLWNTPLLASDLDYHRIPLESDPPEPTPSETNSFQPTPNESDPPEPTPSEMNPLGSKSSGLTPTESNLSEPKSTD